MLFLFNKTIKALDQFAKKKKIQKKSLFLGQLLTMFFTIFDKVFSQNYFFCYTQVLMNLALGKVSEKGTNHFGLIQQAIDRNSSNIHKEKLII